MRKNWLKIYFEELIRRNCLDLASRNDGQVEKRHGIVVIGPPQLRLCAVALQPMKKPEDSTPDNQPL